MYLRVASRVQFKDYLGAAMRKALALLSFPLFHCSFRFTFKDLHASCAQLHLKFEPLMISNDDMYLVETVLASFLSHHWKL